MMKTSQYTTMAIMVEMTLDNTMPCLIDNDSGTQRVSGDEDIASRQHLENKSQQLN
jgi:hypothetical protein